MVTFWSSTNVVKVDDHVPAIGGITLLNIPAHGQPAVVDQRRAAELLIDRCDPVFNAVARKGRSALVS